MPQQRQGQGRMNVGWQAQQTPGLGVRGQGRQVGEEVGVREGKLAGSDVSKVVGGTGEVILLEDVVVGALVEGSIAKEVACRPCSGGGCAAAPGNGWCVV
jgi:hypothetical protein